MVSLRYRPLGQIDVSFGDSRLAAGVANHRLVLSLQLTGTWLNPRDPQSNAQVLLAGTVWCEQPSLRWLTGLEAQVVTLHGYESGEELIVSITDDQILFLDRARGQNDVVVRVKLQATLLAPPESVHPVAHEELRVRVPRSAWLAAASRCRTPWTRR